ncbi:hypothetical protein O6H91_09G044700 [Diphasiastrum complanatum]|uniref:Uncharacterized protein n=1 Tax=Diphasiastrum complanatum TaxID=34168 RepID=A0ACC2CNU5_DIPCM|nr:hypothetical protein O6H91_09G044700 [Diphasiastrum complanatum]
MQRLLKDHFFSSISSTNRNFLGLHRDNLPSALSLASSESRIALKPTRIFLYRSGIRSKGGNNLRARCFSGSNFKYKWEMSVGLVKGLWESIQWAFLANPPTWESAIFANAIIFLVAAQLLRAGLTGAGIAHAFALAVLTWRAFSGQGLFLVAIFFTMGTAATKLKIKQKEVEGTAEKRKGRRGPSSVWGSASAGIFCALFAIAGYGGPSFSSVWKLAFVASFCTKLSDTMSSEIGKAYGKTTYLVTTLQIVPRGTEGAVSVEGTTAGLVASVFLSGAAYALNQDQ